MAPPAGAESGPHLLSSELEYFEGDNMEASDDLWWFGGLTDVTNYATTITLRGILSFCLLSAPSAPSAVRSSSPADFGAPSRAHLGRSLLPVRVGRPPGHARLRAAAAQLGRRP